MLLGLTSCLAIAQNADPTVQSSAPASAKPASNPESRKRADDAYLEGARWLDKNDPVKAEEAFLRASKLNPENADYALAASIAREHEVTALVQQADKERLAGKDASANRLLAEALRLDPQNPVAAQHFNAAQAPNLHITPMLPSEENGPNLAGMIHLHPVDAKQNFHLNGDAHTLWRQVLTSYHIAPQFNPDISTRSQRLDVDNVNFEDACAVLEALTSTFIVALDEKTAFILKDTIANHTDFERQQMETLYMPGTTPEQLNDIASLLRSLFGIKQVSLQSNARTMVLRAPEPLLKIVNAELADLLDGGSEIVLDLRITEVDKMNSRNTGLQTPGSISTYNIYNQAQTLIQQNQTLINQLIASGQLPPNPTLDQLVAVLVLAGLAKLPLFTFGGGTTLTGVTATLPQFNAALNSSDARSLDDVQVRVGDRQSATFRSGMRYPIVTSTYTSSATSSSASALSSLANLSSTALASLASSAATLTVPQVQYEDLGLTLKVTPTVQKSGDISLHLDLKIEALAGSSINNIPVLASRVLTSDVTVHEGSTAFLMSAMTRQESGAVSGLPGLSELPGFQEITDKSTNLDTDELVMTITPHLVRQRRPDFATKPLLITLHESSD